MAIDLTSDWATGFQLGASAVHGGLDLALRSQELRSKQALQQLQEQQTAAQTALVLQHVQQLKEQQRTALLQKADMDAANAIYEDNVNNWGMPQEAAMADAYLPVVAKYAKNPEDIFKAGAALANMQKIKETAQFKPEESTDFGNGIVGAETAPGHWRFFQKPDAKTKPSAFESDIAAVEKRLGRSLSPEEYMNYADVHMGTKARASAAGDIFNKADYSALMKERVEVQTDYDRARQPERKAQYKKRLDEIDAQREKMKNAYAAVEVTHGGPLAPAAPAAPTTPASTTPPTPAGPARPTTQAEFDALPSLREFINPADGKIYKKK